MSTAPSLAEVRPISIAKQQPCGFCGGLWREGQVLLAGVDTSICGHCISSCVNMLQERGLWPPPALETD